MVPRQYLQNIILTLNLALSTIKLRPRWTVQTQCVQNMSEKKRKDMILKNERQVLDKHVMTGSPQGPNHRIWAPQPPESCCCCDLKGGIKVDIPAGELVLPAT